MAQALRRKGSYTPAWVEHMCHDITYRPLSFLVDVGGRPTDYNDSKKIGQPVARLKVNFIGVKSKRHQLRLTH